MQSPLAIRFFQKQLVHRILAHQLLFMYEYLQIYMILIFLTTISLTCRIYNRFHMIKCYATGTLQHTENIVLILTERYRTTNVFHSCKEITAHIPQRWQGQALWGWVSSLQHCHFPWDRTCTKRTYFLGLGRRSNFIETCRPTGQAGTSSNQTV